MTTTGALSIGGAVSDVEAVIDTCPTASPLRVNVPSDAETTLRATCPRAAAMTGRGMATAMVAPATGVPSFCITRPLTSAPRSTVIVTVAARAVSS